MPTSTLPPNRSFVSRAASSMMRRVGAWQPAPPVAVRPPLNFRQGSVQPDELPLLKRLVEQSRRHAGPLIEIGTLFGMTTLHLVRWKAPEQKIVTVDKFCWNPFGFTPDEHLALTSAILTLPCERGDVEIVAQGKDEFYAAYDGPRPALVFLDAVHDYEHTRADIAWAVRLGCPLICGHDYSDEFPGVRQAVDEAGGLEARCGTVWQLRVGGKP